jgi:uncharacterized NAD(P)/FAD-binding protein YdhS
MSTSTPEQPQKPTPDFEGRRIPGKDKTMNTADGSESDCCDIAIVGGGCSGALVAVQLLRNGFAGRIRVIEPRPRLGYGLAYSTVFEQHLLNVQAGKMSALPDEPAHFLGWLRSRRWDGAAPEAFAPRRLYGQYIEDLLESSVRAQDRGNFRHICAEVVDARGTTGGVTLALNDGAQVEARKAVLALGNPASATFEHAFVKAMGEQWHVSPWIGEALRVRFAGERILLVGMGLTAVDAALALHGQGKPCKTHMISRRGILPFVHDLRYSPTPPPSFEDPTKVRLMFRQLRSQIKQLQNEDGCWRMAVDALRPVSNEIWQGVPLSGRSQFLRHLKPYWEAHRHRMAPQARRHMCDLQAQGKVELIAGRICETSAKGGAIELTIAQRRGPARFLEVDRAINCTGIHEDYTKGPRRLIRSLIESGLASANDLGMGFRTDGAGALIDAHGIRSSVLLTLGPPRRGELFETTAVPEIRCQAEALARRLIQETVV